jgi:HJR/Mrr/RecB family endonuclease
MSNQPTLSDPTAVRRLHELNDEIPRLEAEAAQLQKDRAAAARKTGLLRWRRRYLRFVRWFRRPVARFSLWPTAVMLVAPLIGGVVFLILVDLSSGGIAAKLVAFGVGTFVAASTFGAFLYCPADAVLLAAIMETDVELDIAQARLVDAVAQVTTASKHLQSLVTERRELVASAKLQRERLLQRNWRAMRGDEWENYLVEACQALGAQVERTGRAGDQGVDLVVEFAGRRIAIQAKGYYHAVNNKAVQEVYAGMAHRGCDGCAVITNSRFAKSARDLAESTGCVLIGEDELPRFVMGEIPL